MTSGRTTPSSCFRISLLPHTRRPLGTARVFIKLASGLGLANLYSRRQNPFHYVFRERFSQPVLKCLLEHDRIDRDLYNVSVEHGIVLPQKIRLVQSVRDDRDHAVVGLDDSVQSDLLDVQALLP